jgi:hypothetical protein
MCYGSRDLCKQVYLNIQMYDVVKTYSKIFMPTSMVHYGLKEFATCQLNNSKIYNHINRLPNFETVDLNSVSSLHKELILQLNEPQPFLTLQRSPSCWFNKTCKYINLYV